jgi:hypothetical protein
MDISAAAKVSKIIQDPERLVHFKWRPVTSIIAVFAMEITGLGHMPLKSENLGCGELFVNIDCPLEGFLAPSN